jgi:uroporphyrinogen decarboxylase
VEPLVGELADAGVQVLESVQPEANNVERLKREHGDRLSFWGTVGDQSVLPFGTPAEVRDQIRTRIETVGQGGGFIIAPAHVVEPEVPVENVFAFFEAVEEFGQYT